jgi:hypothetical protein
MFVTKITFAFVLLISFNIVMGQWWRPNMKTNRITFNVMTKAQRIQQAQRVMATLQGKPMFPHSRLVSPQRRFRVMEIEGEGKIEFVHILGEMPKNIVFYPKGMTLDVLPAAHRGLDRLQGQPQFPGHPEAVHMRQINLGSGIGYIKFNQVLGEEATQIQWFQKPVPLAELPTAGPLTAALPPRVPEP